MATPQRIAQVREKFQELYGGEPTLVRAPGRVNLIGEHTDYNDGFVLPVAIDRDVLIGLRPRTDRIVNLYSLNFGEEASFPLLQIEPDPSTPWSNYVRGVAKELLDAGATLPGIDAVIEGDVPVASGLSSSAAMEVATAQAFRTVGDVPLDDVQLALLCQRAENEFIGVKCGIMDQFISMLGRSGHALLIDCRSLDYQPVPLAGAPVSVVVADTTVRRGLVDSEYNARREQCEEAVRILRQFLPDIRALRDVSVEDLLRHRDALPEVVRKRAEHVVGENERTVDGAAALRGGDLQKFGEFMNASHVSLRDLYEVSIPELDALVEAAWSVEGVYGSRMTGAGFGGCTVSLVQPDAVPTFIAKVSEDYTRRTGKEAILYPCTVEDGASLIR